MTVEDWLRRNVGEPGRITLDCGPDRWYLGRWTLPKGRRSRNGCPDSSFGPLGRDEALRACAKFGIVPE